MSTHRVLMMLAAGVLLAPAVEAIEVDAPPAPANPAPVARELGSADAPLPRGPVEREMNGVTYAIGGVGDEEQDALRQMRGRFNLAITIATAGGKYLPGGTVRIANQDGRTLIEVPADGPLMLAKLAPGIYSVQVVAGGDTETRSVTIGTSGMQEVSIALPSHEPIKAGDAPEEDIPADVPEER